MYSRSLTTKSIFLVALVLCTLNVGCGLSISDYIKIREKAISDEEATYFGENLKLNEDEAIANKCLMSVKQREIDEGYKNLSRLLPARDFLEVRPDIEQTPTYKILRRMPKGAALHTHIGATVSLDFIHDNLTFIPDSYVCLENNTVRFRFFETPDKNCNWHLMEDLRMHSQESITKIRNHLTLPKLSTPGYNSDLLWMKLDEMQQAFSGIITYRPAHEKYLYRTLEELYEDNVMYAEVRTSVYKLYELNGTVNDPIEAVKIFKRVIDEFVATHPGFLGVKLIHTANRKSSCEDFTKEVEYFRNVKNIYPDLVIGFDLSHHEDEGHPNVYFIEKLLELSNETNFYFHAGETNWLGHPVDENLFDAVLLNAKRIGHGFALLKHPRLLELVREKNIAIEVNPISSQMGNFNDLRNHPASHYFAKNLSIVVSNDDPTFWNASGLSYDFYEAFIGIMSRKADLRSLKQLAINSISYSALTAEEKQTAFGVWNESWIKFIEYLAYECDEDKKKLKLHL